VTASVINIREQVEYVVACPVCGSFSMEIHVDSFDLSLAGIKFVECVDCGKRVGVRGDDV